MKYASLLIIVLGLLGSTLQSSPTPIAEDTSPNSSSTERKETQSQSSDHKGFLPFETSGQEKSSNWECLSPCGRGRSTSR